MPSRDDPRMTLVVDESHRGMAGEQPHPRAGCPMDREERLVFQALPSRTGLVYSKAWPGTFRTVWRLGLRG